jgi:L,D-transpeptidase ErfK/SrfK
MDNIGEQSEQLNRPLTDAFAPMRAVLASMKQLLPVLILSSGLVCTFAIRPGSERVVRHSSDTPPAFRAEQVGVDEEMAGPDPLFAPVVGEEQRYEVKRGDTLLAIARRFNTDAATLARLNGLEGDCPKPGTRLLLPTMHILPSIRRTGIVLNVPERGVYLFRRGRLLARFPVAVGMRTWETPVGTFKVVRKVKNPTWIPPKVMVKREHIPASLVKPGKDNPLGDRWIGWSAPEVGFHSTFLVDTVGKLASHACVRMYPESAHKLFDSVQIGMPIYARYEPIKLGKRDGVIYLSVSPDVYKSGDVSLENVRKKLEEAGVADEVDQAKVKRIVSRQDGYLWPVAREDPDSAVAASAERTPRVASRPTESLPPH